MAWSDVNTNSGSNSNQGQEVKYAKLKEGSNKGRILDEQPFSRWTHWIPQANGGKGCSVDCIGNDCPVCKAIKEDKKANRKTKYSKRKTHAINWLNRDTGEVEVLDKGNKVFAGLLVLLQQMGDLRNYDVNIVKTGEGFNTDYQVLPVFPPVPLTEAEKNLEKYSVEVMKKEFTKEQIEKLMQGALLDSINEDSESSDFDNSNAQVDFSQPV